LVIVSRKEAAQFLLLCLAPALCFPAQTSEAPPKHAFFRVQAAASVPQKLDGRLLIFVKQGAGDKEVATDEFHPSATWVAAHEIHDLAPGASVEVDADDISFPRPFSALPAGDYEAQAVLDTEHTYNYSGRNPNDWISSVINLHWMPGVGTEPLLVLDQHAPKNERREAMISAAMAKAQPGVAQKEEMVSPSLSQFWGHPVAIRAWVILPPGYSISKGERYPTVWWTHGFGGDLDLALVSGLALRARMEQAKMPPMIWVMLDESIPEGTHEFADSVNNGPWGRALTTEFMPYVERKYRMDARRDGRFLNGHSSGGWATLQLEINYPQIFGGTWSTSPDSSDFHDFTGPDLYAPHANVYRKPDGSPWPLVRSDGKVVATFEEFARLEAVLGPYGGQMSSFDWVFSPKGDSGAPEPMFERRTGDVNPNVVAYWRDHYDLAHIAETTWNARGAYLKGRIHVLVGTADTFYLDGAAHKLQTVLDKLGADAHFSFLEGKTHMDLYAVGQDRMALMDTISAEMYAIARPGKEWKANSVAPHF
jgi:S-formylglutathione hydrolase FrmB